MYLSNEFKVVKANPLFLPPFASVHETTVYWDTVLDTFKYIIISLNLQNCAMCVR